MANTDKFLKAVRTLKSNAELSLIAPIENENDFKKVLWNTGVDSNGSAIQSTTCPHSEITWTAVKEEMDKL